MEQPDVPKGLEVAMAHGQIATTTWRTDNDFAARLNGR
jgi:hypothetical protein